MSGVLVDSDILFEVFEGVSLSWLEHGRNL